MSAMRSAARLLTKFQNSRPELVLRRLPRNTENSVFITKYENYLKNTDNLNFEVAASFVNFTGKQFRRFPKKIVKKLIDDSLQLLKDKDIANHTPVYNTIIRNYLSNSISFNIRDILKEMNDNNIAFNKGTYELLVEIYCKSGETDATENLLEVMKTKQIEIDEKIQNLVISGYVRSGEISKSLDFMKERNIKEDSFQALRSIANGYASGCDIDNLMKTIEKIKVKYQIRSSDFFTWYCELLKGNASSEDLEQILSLLTSEGNKFDHICDLIIILNENGFYNHSWKLVERFKDELVNEKLADQLVTSFNVEDCPISVYKNVLMHFLNFIDVYSQRNLFTNISYDEAHKIVVSILNTENSNILLTSLFNKTISLNSIKELHTTYDLAFSNMTFGQLNFLMHVNFIPSMFQSGMAKNWKDLINIMPRYKNTLIPALLIYHLSKGNFFEFNNILASYPSDFGYIYTIHNFKIIARETLRNLSFREMPNFVKEAKKGFKQNVVFNMLRSIIFEKLLVSSKKNDTEGINEALNLAQNYDLYLFDTQVNYFQKNFQENFKLIQKAMNNIRNKVDEENKSVNNLSDKMNDPFEEMSHSSAKEIN